ncbi:hypothetical protein BJ170DRAFT_382902 [Xylariales sp. AK1849]|nr:hypothetical protein BJ170DRAFT_382902 [Xylariales sp. AK1849]
MDVLPARPNMSNVMSQDHSGTTYCLRRGYQCGYQDASPIGTGAFESHETLAYGHLLHSPNGTGNLHSLLPTHDLVGFPLELSCHSRAIFHFFSGYMTRSNSGTTSSRSQVVQRAVGDPNLLHAALLIASVQWLWYNQPSQAMLEAFLHHKLEAVRYVNSQLSCSRQAVSDTTLVVISSLVIVESSLGSSRDVAYTHLNGLAHIMALRGTGPVKPGSRLLSKMVKLLV